MLKIRQAYTILARIAGVLGLVLARKTITMVVSWHQHSLLAFLLVLVQGAVAGSVLLAQAEKACAAVAIV